VRMLGAELGRPRYGGSPNFAELVVLAASIRGRRFSGKGCCGRLDVCPVCSRCRH
jgi:hypothetical protein